MTKPNFSNLRMRVDDVSTAPADRPRVIAIILQHLKTYQEAGNDQMYLSALLPDVFFDKTTNQDVDVTLAEAIEYIA